jgi:hypothetical protein
MHTNEHRSLFIRLCRAMVLGWLTLFVLAYLVELALLRSAPLLGAAWFPTARVLLDCGVLVAAGWVVGRAGPTLAVVLLALSLTPRDFSPLLPLNVPWLLRLAIDSFHDSRFLESLFTTAAGQALLFGCFFAGARLARPRSPALRLGLGS